MREINFIGIATIFFMLFFISNAYAGQKLDTNYAYAGFSGTQYVNVNKVAKDSQKQYDNNILIINDLNLFINEYLEKQLDIPVRQDGRINAKVLDDKTMFFSNNAIYQSLKQYFKLFNHDIGTPAEAKKYMIALVNQLRDKNMLAKKITQGFYSNSFMTKVNGRVKREYGVFVKKEQE